MLLVSPFIQGGQMIVNQTLNQSGVLLLVRDNTMWERHDSPNQMPFQIYTRTLRTWMLQFHPPCTSAMRRHLLCSMMSQLVYN